MIRTKSGKGLEDCSENVNKTSNIKYSSLNRN